MTAALIEMVFKLEQTIQKGKNGEIPTAVVMSKFKELKSFILTNNLHYQSEENLVSILAGLNNVHLPLKFRVMLIACAHFEVPFTVNDICAIISKSTPKIVNAVSVAYHLKTLVKYEILSYVVKGKKGRNNPNVYKLIKE